MADLGGHLPPPGSAVWSRDVRPADNEGRRSGVVGTRSSDMPYTMIVRHVVIGDAEIWEEPTPYVVYRINVHTQQDQWYLYRRYSQFHTLHKKLVKAYGVNKDLLPPKKISGNLSKQLIDKRRKSLERYLQKLIHNTPEIARSPELQVFLDVPTHDVVKVTDILTRHLYLHGDHLLENVTPIALSINELYAITLRLQLPSDTSDGGDVAGDLAHLYGFVHQLKRLRITPPPPPCSVTCMTFDLSPFRSLHTLKLDHVRLSQVCGLLQLQQHLERLTVQWTLHSLDELLVVSVEERRRGSVVPGGGAAGLEGSLRSPSLTSSDDSWRKSATEKFTSARVVVRCWQKLHTLVLSHNFLTHLDDSLDLLPSLCELNLSHNRLQVLSVPFLCLPNLEKLNVSHNQIHSIDDKGKVLERITHLNMSHNRIYSLDGVKAFVGVHVLNLAYNRLVSGEDVSKIVRLRRLATLGLEGNPISSSGACRIVVLAKFKIARMKVELDGLPTTSREESRIESYRKKYGNEPWLWPVAKPLQELEKEVSVNYQPHKLRLLSASEPGFRHPRAQGSTTPPSPHMDLTLQTQRRSSKSQQHRQQRPSPSLHPQTSPSESGASPGRHQRSPPLRTHRGSSRDIRATPPIAPHSRPSTSRSSVDRLSFSSSEQSAQVSQSLSAAYRPASAKIYRRNARPDDATPTRPHPSSSFSGTDFYTALPEEERYSVGVAHQQGSRGKQAARGLVPRSDPDGQSDVSSTSPDFMLRHPSSSRTSFTTPHRLSVASALSLSPPPPSPSLDLSLLNSEAPPTQTSHTPHSNVTPAMIQSALDALEGIQDKGVPLSLTARHSSMSSASRQSPVLPGEVTNALTAWISSQSLHQPPPTSGASSRASVQRTPLRTPPPTPKRLQSSDKNSVGLPDIQQGGDSQGADYQGGVEVSEREGISAQDLIDALSTLIVSPEERPPSSGPSSRGDSVPACTPREGFSEWAKMGIRPEEVIHALSALTIHQEAGCEDAHRGFEQRSPTASPEPSSEGEYPQEVGGHLCLFPETKELSEEEEQYGHHRTHLSVSPPEPELEEQYGHHRTHLSVSPPEPELEQLDPFLHPDTHSEQPLSGHIHTEQLLAGHTHHLDHSGSQFDHSGSSLEATGLHLQPAQLQLNRLQSPHPASTRTAGADDGFGVVDLGSALMVQRDSLRESGSVSSHSSVEDRPVTQDPQEGRHGNKGVAAQIEDEGAHCGDGDVSLEEGGAHCGNESMAKSLNKGDQSMENTTTEQSTLEVGVEVGAVSSSPIESCLYADS